MSGLFECQSMALAAYSRVGRNNAGGRDVWLERLSSGLRVNSARDDAAGLAIADRMTSSIRGAAVVARGMMDGISLLQTADGGLEKVAVALQRARELAVQSANGSLSDADRIALDFEYRHLMAQIDLISDSNEAFGIHLLKARETLGDTPDLQDLFPTSGTSRNGLQSGIRPLAHIPVGATDVRIDINALGLDDDLQIFTADGQHLLGTPLSDVVWTTNGVQNAADFASTVLTSANGFSASAVYDGSALLDGATTYADPGAGGSLPLTASALGMNFSYSGDGDYADGSSNNGVNAGPFLRESLVLDVVTQPLLVMVVGTGQFDATVSWGSMPGSSASGAGSGAEPASVGIALDDRVGAQDNLIQLERMPASSASLGLGSTALATAQAAQGALGPLNAAIDTISGYRAKLGAAHMRFERSIEQQEQEAADLHAARSRILDADFASTSSELSGSRIRSEAAQAMLAQANTTSQQVLDVLLNGVQ